MDTTSAEKENAGPESAWGDAAGLAVEETEGMSGGALATLAAIKNKTLARDLPVRRLLDCGRQLARDALTAHGVADGLGFDGAGISEALDAAEDFDGFTESVHYVQRNTLLRPRATACYLDGRVSSLHPFYMQKPKPKVKETDKAGFKKRFEQMLAQCEMDRASFAKAARLQNGQVISNWLARGRVGVVSEEDVVRATGVSMDWLQRGLGDPFPNGSKIHGQPARLVKVGGTGPADQRLTIIRLEKDVDALRNMLNSLASAVTEVLPAAGKLASQALKAIQKDNHSDRGSYAELLQVLDEAQDNSEAALQAARRRATFRRV